MKEGIHARDRKTTKFIETKKPDPTDEFKIITPPTLYDPEIADKIITENSTKMWYTTILISGILIVFSVI